jgi:hypothetical protein
VFNYTRHKDVWGSESTAPFILNLEKVQVSGQFHAPAPSPLDTTYRYEGRSAAESTQAVEKSPCPCPCLESNRSRPICSSPVTTTTEPSRLLQDVTTDFLRPETGWRSLRTKLTSVKPKMKITTAQQVPHARTYRPVVVKTRARTFSPRLCGEAAVPERLVSFYICINISKFGRQSSATPQSRNKPVNQKSLQPGTHCSSHYHVIPTRQLPCLFGDQRARTQSQPSHVITLLSLRGLLQ